MIDWVWVAVSVHVDFKSNKKKVQIKRWNTSATKSLQRRETHAKETKFREAKE